MSAAIAQLHAEWAARHVPPGASEIQRQEMERAFYSGFIACLVHQLNYVATIEDDDAAASEIDALHVEGETYLRGMADRLRDNYPRQ